MSADLYGYVEVDRYPFGRTSYQMATLIVEPDGELTIEQTSGEAWYTVRAGNWYEAKQFDGNCQLLAHHINPHAPERTSVRPPREFSMQGA